MRVYCLDLEGVLIPEIWINVAKRFSVEELKLTTRDIPDYDKLMRYRLGILRAKKIRLKDIQRVIKRMEPLPGAKGFLSRLRLEGPVILLSDTFYEFSLPLMQKLGSPTLFCNWLVVDRAGNITGYKLRQKDGKRRAVQALRSSGFCVKAVGDSYNDLTMLRAAHGGVLFRPPAGISAKNKKFPVAKTYSMLFKLLLK